MTVFEAFIPSGSEAPDLSAGYFTGAPADIKQWVAIHSQIWKPEDVRLEPRRVIAITSDSVSTLVHARESAAQAIAALRRAERGEL